MSKVNIRRTSSDGKNAHGHNRGWIMDHHFTLGLKIYKFMGGFIEFQLL